MKKRIKLREKDAKKAEKLANAPPADTAKKDKENVEEEITDPTMYFENRSKIIQKLRQTQAPNPYPYKFNPSMSIPTFIKTFSNLENGDRLRDQPVLLAGRVLTVRSSGSKLKFYGNFSLKNMATHSDI